MNPASIVQWWLHLRPEALDLAIKKGHRVIISPTNYLYFDYPNHVGEPALPGRGMTMAPIRLNLFTSGNQSLTLTRLRKRRRSLDFRPTCGQSSSRQMIITST